MGHWIRTEILRGTHLLNGDLVDFLDLRVFLAKVCQNMRNTCPKHAQTLPKRSRADPKTIRKPAQNDPKSIPKASQNHPKTFQNHPTIAYNSLMNRLLLGF